ncbi:MAG: HU family DNA-binding protein [Tannerellaceae bacterium]
MALRYKTVWKKDMRKDAQEGAKLLYGATVVTAQYSFDQLCKDITDNCSATASDVMMVVSAMVTMAKKALLRGETVVINGFGNLRLQAGSQGVGSEDEFKTNLMKKPKVIFRPSTSLLEVRGQVRYEALQVTEKTVECDKPHSLD